MIFLIEKLDYYIVALLKLISAQVDCNGKWKPVCAGPGPVSESGEVMIFPSVCHLEEYNMAYPKRRMYFKMERGILMISHLFPI